MEKSGVMSLVIVAAVGLGMVFSTGGGSDSNLIGHAIEFTTTKTVDLTSGSLIESSIDTKDLSLTETVTIEPSCIDPDGETGYATKTTVTQPGFTNKVDRCRPSDGKLLEGYCASDQPRYRAYICETMGMVCNDGACVSPIIDLGLDSSLEGVTDCADPDGKKGYATKTTVSQAGFTSKTDKCRPSDGKLLEGYCRPDYGPRYKGYLCENVGMVCDDGACVRPEAEVVHIPTWVEPSSDRLSGNEICTDAEFSRCLAAEQVTYRNYYSTIDGFCTSNSNLRLSTKETRTVSCTTGPQYVASRCVHYRGDIRLENSPNSGDLNEYMRIYGAWCY